VQDDDIPFSLISCLPPYTSGYGSIFCHDSFPYDLNAKTKVITVKRRNTTSALISITAIEPFEGLDALVEGTV
jgi:hypothetical protein